MAAGACAGHQMVHETTGVLKVGATADAKAPPTAGASGDDWSLRATARDAMAGDHRRASQSPKEEAGDHRRSSAPWQTAAGERKAAGAQMAHATNRHEPECHRE